MSYIDLRELYYTDKERYQTEYSSRISSPDTVQLNFKIKKNPGFFIQTSEVSNLAIQILKTDKKISRISSRLPRVAITQFTRRCLIDEIILTNKIEGVYSTRREISGVLDELSAKTKKTRKRRRFFGLVAEYQKLQKRAKIPLDTCQDIRNLYDDIVLQEVVEENPNNAPDGKIFRKDSASIHTKTDKEIHRGVYPESAICEEMDKALAFLKNDEIELLYRVSAFHYMLEYIHPFYDGNGRLGRFIVSYLLSQELDPLLAYRLSYTITQNITAYYDAFKVCNEPKNLGDITPFIIMMLNMVKESTDQLENALNKRLTRLRRYEEIIEQLPCGDNSRTGKLYYCLIQAGLFAEHGISTKELEGYLENSYTTVKNELKIVENANLLKMEKVGKEKFYSLDLEKLDKLIFEES